MSVDKPYFSVDTDRRYSEKSTVALTHDQWHVALIQFVSHYQFDRNPDGAAAYLDLIGATTDDQIPQRVFPNAISGSGARQGYQLRLIRDNAPTEG